MSTAVTVMLKTAQRKQEEGAREEDAPGLDRAQGPSCHAGTPESAARTAY